MLRPTGSRPASLGIKHSTGSYDQVFITVIQFQVCWYGALSLTRRQVCRLQLLLILVSVVILGSESHGTRNHILLSQIQTCLFVASYDSQGYGGGIRPHLHTGRTILVKIKVILRPTVSRPVYRGTKHPFRAYDQIFITCVTLPSL
jgi:hypothetical protein